MRKLKKVIRGEVMNKTKRRIFNTAIKLFSEKGYDNTNIEEITAIAGVAKGSLYYHFAKKEAIRRRRKAITEQYRN